MCAHKQDNPEPQDPSTPAAGDTDIACASNASPDFVIDPSSSGWLVLNTANPNWFGSTTVKAGGGLIVGESPAYPKASWGNPAKTGDVNVNSNAVLGGLGTIYANSDLCKGQHLADYGNA